MISFCRIAANEIGTRKAIDLIERSHGTVFSTMLTVERRKWRFDEVKRSDAIYIYSAIDWDAVKFPEGTEITPQLQGALDHLGIEEVVFVPKAEMSGDLSDYL